MDSTGQTKTSEIVYMIYDIIIMISHDVSYCIAGSLKDFASMFKSERQARIKVKTIPI